jgi:hypothetical protein
MNPRFNHDHVCTKRLSSFAFMQEHRRCGELEGGVEGECAWMARDWSATPLPRVEPAGLEDQKIGAHTATPLV